MTMRMTILYQNLYRMAKSWMKSKKRNAQRACLLRCWQEGGDTPGRAPRWRFSVEEVLRKQPRRGFGDLILDSGRRLKWPTSRESNSIAFEEASHPHRSLAPDEKNTTHTTVRNRPPETVESKEFGWHRIDVGLARFSVSRESFAQPTHWCCRVVAELAKR